MSCEEIRRRLETAPLPIMIVLDVTNTCNLCCVHCPQPVLRRKPGFRPRHLEWDLFVKVVEEIRTYRHRCLLRLAGDGEPLLHPRILEMVELACRESAAVVNLTTNGVLLTPDRMTRLLEAGIDVIDVSLDALTGPTYERVRGGDLERVVSQLLSLVNRIRVEKRRTKVVVSFVEQEANREESAAFRKFWAPIADHVLIRTLHSAAGFVRLEESRRTNRADSIERHPCPHLWKRLTVDYAGRIKFCAHDWADGGSHTLGHLASSSLAAEWKGAALAALRWDHVSGEFKAGTLCADCTDWASSPWNYGYERIIDKVVFEEPVLMPEYPLLSRGPASRVRRNRPF